MNRGGGFLKPDPYIVPRRNTEMRNPHQADRRITALAALLVLLLGLGCQRNSEPEDCEPDILCSEDYSNEENLAWYHFNLGTTWIFLDSVSQVLDTLTVVESNLIVDDNLFGFEWKAEFSSDGSICGMYYVGPETSDAECSGYPECRCRTMRLTFVSVDDGVFRDKGMLRFPHFIGNETTHSCSQDFEGDGNGVVTITDISEEFMFNEELYTGSVDRHFDCGIQTAELTAEDMTWVRGLGPTHWRIGEVRNLHLVEASVQQ